MIHAYDSEWFLTVHPDADPAEYMRATQVAASAGAVKGALLGYSARHDPAPAVYDLLGRLTSDPYLLAKLRIVRDRQWGNCTLLITPDGARVTAGGILLLDGTPDLDATLRYWRRHAEAILVQLEERAPAPEGRKPVLESLQWLTHWQFKRNFAGLLANS